MIPDTHFAPADWGILPILFSGNGFVVTSYGLFVLLGLAAAVALYYYNVRGKSVGNNGLVIAMAALVGGIIGAKLPIWVANLPAIVADPSAASLLGGRTIVGGIIGGALTVYAVKRRMGISQRLGNYLVPSLALGIFLGRMGCFFTGCCYGKSTGLPWGVDFGDAIARHPTQLYEAAFVLVLGVVAQATKERFAPGVLFKWFMVLYFGWRFSVEFIRVSEVSALGLTYYQLAALGVVLGYGARLLLDSRKAERDEVEREAAA